ncbi:MAG TPA: hypothetical protein VKY36_01780 [Moheibacter sp.]|nr:hypothetical protein [Moheibacter sp.]
MKNVLCELLEKIAFVTQQLKPEEYAEPLPLLMNNSIGKHIRHILDLMECLCASHLSGELNYDMRNRDQQIETSPQATSLKINYLRNSINNLNEEKKIKLKQKISGLEVLLETHTNREILYNIEHSVHHLAIIRMGIEHYFPHIELPKNFGIAHSTAQHRETENA